MNYEYDDLNRVITYDGPGPETYTYDGEGRLDTKGPLDLKYEDADHLHAVSEMNGLTPCSYSYDANGNMTNRCGWSQTYDAENRMKSTSANGRSGTFTYDGDSQRTKGTITTNTSQPDVLELSVEVSSQAGNTYTYRTFDNTTTYTIQSGDYLEFDVYLGTDNPVFEGGFDAVLSTSGAVRGSGWVDQNGLSIHPGTNLQTYARGQWYHRKFSIGNKAGETLSDFKIAHEGDAVGYYTILLDNIKITNGGSVTRKSIYTGGVAKTNVQAEGPTINISAQTMERSYSRTTYYINPAFEVELPDTLSLSVETNSLTGNAYTYRTFDTTTTYTIQSGDYLEFDVYLDANNPVFEGGFDAVLSTSGIVRGSGWMDQNGLSIHPGTNLQNYARGQWYHRKFSIGNKAGETLSDFKIAHEGDAAGYYTILLDNIKITNGGTTVKKTIYTTGFSSVNVQAEGPTSHIVFQTILRATSYYQAGSQSVAVRRSGYLGGNGLSYLLLDHLGSTRKEVRKAGSSFQVTSELRYKTWGETQLVSGIPTAQHRFTSQQDEPELGITFFQSRWYDSSLGHFISPDSIIPPNQGTQGFDRFAFVSNNPVNYTDPSGHMQTKDEDTRTENVEILSSKGKEIYELYETWKDVYGDLSEQDFFGWMMAYEMNGMQDVEFILDGKSVTVLEILKEVVARQLFGDSLKSGGHMPYCYSSPCSTAGLFNFLANYVQVARDRAKQSSPLNPLDYPTGYQKENPVEMLRDELLTDAASFINDVLNANPASKTYGDDLPYHWGNAEWGDDRDYGTTNKTGLVYRNGNFLIYTANQGPKK